MEKNFILVIALIAVILVGGISGCSKEAIKEEPKQPPTEIPQGILVDRIPYGADIIFVSMRYVLQDRDCLDDDYNLKKNFLNDLSCNKKIYSQESNVLASPRQLYTLDIDTREVIQLTNINCDFSSSKPVGPTQIMAVGACSDTDGDGIMSTKDKIGIYLIDLKEKTTNCLTCELDITSINNPDYSPINKKFLFSAQEVSKFHNYLFTLDLDGNLEKITDSEYMDFDCSWSEDGTKIVFNRMPKQDYPFVIPSQVWIMDADGKNQIKITDGGPNPNKEEPQGSYPIGIDADPDLSPDNKEVVFSRLKTGKQNMPFGVYELIILNIDTGEETILDSSYANMIPEWKDQGIVFVRQIGSMTSVMDRKQSLYVYKDGEFINLEPEYDVFPIGANGGSWL